MSELKELKVMIQIDNEEFRQKLEEWVESRDSIHTELVNVRDFALPQMGIAFIPLVIDDPVRENEIEYLKDALSAPTAQEVADNFATISLTAVVLCDDWR